MPDDASSTATTPAKPPIRFRRLRIALSLFFGLLAIVFLMLWVRSYWRVDNLWWQVTPHRTLFVRVTPGQLTWWHATQTDAYPMGEWKKYTYPTSDYAGDFEGTITRPFLGGTLTTHLKHNWPIWLPTTISIFVAALASFGLPIQFSLSTLLIVTTLVAVVLGMMVWMLR